jgi:hypothetical protein
MTNHTIISSLLACTALMAGGLLAQDNPQAAQPGNIDLTGIPAPRGIYYHAAGGGWVTLSSTVLMPSWEGKAMVLEILNVGSDHMVTEMPGSHAGVQIGNDTRPTFYLHGISPADLYLVRAIPKDDYRELRMPVSRNFRDWAHFRAVDLTPVEIQAVNGDVVAIKPTADLKAGEYALASIFQTSDRWIRLGFDFGIVSVSTRR